MFVVYALAVGLLAGFLLGGRLGGLARLDFRWAPVALAGFIAQLAIFGPLAGSVGPAGPPLYVASTVTVLVAVVRNLRITGLPLVALGAVSNLAAILANGGLMPADPGALALAGLAPGEGFSNSVVLDAPALRPLTDVFALPAGLPLANVFSVGDVLIAAGIAIAVAAAMRRSGDPVLPGNSYD